MVRINRQGFTDGQRALAERLVLLMHAAEAEGDTPEQRDDIMSVLVADFVAESQALEGHHTSPRAVLDAAQSEERAVA